MFPLLFRFCFFSSFDRCISNSAIMVRCVSQFRHVVELFLHWNLVFKTLCWRPLRNALAISPFPTRLSVFLVSEDYGRLCHLHSFDNRWHWTQRNCLSYTYFVFSVFQIQGEEPWRLPWWIHGCPQSGAWILLTRTVQTSSLDQRCRFLI